MALNQLPGAQLLEEERALLESVFLGRPLAELAHSGLTSSRIKSLASGAIRLYGYQLG